MPTIAEVLKQSGFTDEQINAMDAKMLEAANTYVSSAAAERAAAEKARQEAQAARDQAEIAQRSNVEFYETKISPSLSQWETEKAEKDNAVARANAEIAYYRTQFEEHKKNGLIPAEVPGFDPTKFVAPNNPNQPRDPQGRYVAGAPGSTPGSPTFDVNKVYERAGDAIGILTDIQWEHQRLFGQPLPISPTELVRQADAMKLDPKSYAARTYNWDARRQQIRDEEQRKHDEEVAAKALAPMEQKLKEAEEAHKKELSDLNRKFAESAGSNPDVRRTVDARQTEILRAVSAKELPDPLLLSDQQRRAQTSQMIRKDIESAA